MAVKRKLEAYSDDNINRLFSYLKLDRKDIEKINLNRHDPDKQKEIILEASTEPEITRQLDEAYDQIIQRLIDKVIDDYVEIEEQIFEEKVLKIVKVKKPKPGKASTPVAIQKVKKFTQKTESGKIYKRSHNRWNKEQENFIKYSPGTNGEVAKRFREHFGVNRSVASIKRKKSRMGET